MVWDNKLTVYIRNANYFQAKFSHENNLIFCRGSARRNVQMSCSNHSVSAVISGPTNDEYPFTLLDWVNTVECLANGETCQFHESTD